MARASYLEQNSGATFGHKLKVEIIKAARTLTGDDSGKVFMLDSAGGAYSITLPTAALGQQGSYYKFIVEEETPTAAITIAAGSAIISFVQKDAGGDASNSTAGTQISNVIVGTSAQKGDVIELMFANGEYVGSVLSGINDAITAS
tara:strand:+ start:114 stop:551 length:438 start_codon:yes stop_codon:yes gene_type:complete